MNLVEVFFGIITRQAIRRGISPSVADLIAAIRRFIDGWNERCEPFSWTKDADTVLRKANRQDASVTRHQARPANRTARRKVVPAAKLQTRCASHRQARDTPTWKGESTCSAARRRASRSSHSI